MSHALNILKQFSFPGNNKFLFTMSITSIYTVILNNEGLLACYKAEQAASNVTNHEEIWIFGHFVSFDSRK